jgi:hypothetical protein
MPLNLSSGVGALSEKLGALGYERARRAVAGLALSFFAIVYFFIALNAPLPGWETTFFALAACYVVAFFAVVAEWFWGRWFATGLGWSGLMVAIVSVVMIGWDPALVIYGLLHAAIILPLAGKSMAARYDLQEGWRQRYKMDDLGVARLRKTITRSSASLPSLILWALGPKEPGQGMLLSLACSAADLGLAGGRHVGPGHGSRRQPAGIRELPVLRLFCCRRAGSGDLLPGGRCRSVRGAGASVRAGPSLAAPGPSGVGLAPALSAIRRSRPPSRRRVRLRRSRCASRRTTATRRPPRRPGTRRTGPGWWCGSFPRPARPPRGQTAW